MSHKIIRKRLLAISDSIENAISTFGQFPPLKHPYFLNINFVPPGAPEDHDIRIMHDGRGYTGGAQRGHYELSIYNVDDPNMYIASAGFVEHDGLALCDRLSVDVEHRGNGLGLTMLEIGRRLYQRTIYGAEAFKPNQEGFWASPDPV